MLRSQQGFIPRAAAVTAVVVLVAGCAAVAARNAGRIAAAAPEVISIAAARALPPGAAVTVEGSVSVPSGAFKSGTSDEGFAIQDASGGIYVRTGANLGFGLRQRVRVNGRLADTSGQLILVPERASDVRMLGRGSEVRAEEVSTGRIDEATEGRLVRVTGTIAKPIGDDLPYGYRLFINDGSGEVQAFVYASTGIDVSKLRPGHRIGVTGFGAQYKDHYEIIPRFQTDIRRSRSRPN